MNGYPWEVAIALVLACGLCVLVGWEACRLTHRHRGIVVCWQQQEPPPTMPDTAEELLEGTRV